MHAINDSSAPTFPSLEYRRQIAHVLDKCNCSAVTAAEAEDKIIYMLHLANNSDRMCHPVAVLYVHEFQAMYNIVKDPQVIALRTRGGNGDGSGNEQISILSP